MNALVYNVTFPVPVLTSAISRSGLEYITAKDSKDGLEEYFNYILELNATLIGDELPVDAFYLD